MRERAGLIVFQAFGPSIGGHASDGGFTVSAPDDKPVESMSFEEALAALTALVERLESGDMPLEESVAAFERGVKLSRRCEALLDEAEQRLQVLGDGAGRD